MVEEQPYLPGMELGEDTDELVYESPALLFGPPEKSTLVGCSTQKPLAAKAGLPEDAPGILDYASSLIADRGQIREQRNGERSMDRAVRAFNEMTNHTLTEDEGWLFMVYLKHSRSMSGKFNRDDHDDAVAYEALRAEAILQRGNPS